MKEEIENAKERVDVENAVKEAVENTAEAALTASGLPESVPA